MAINLNKIAMSLALMATAGSAAAAAKPNILAIMGDDIGYWNISAYNQGMMGYQTRTSTVSPAKVLSLPIITVSNPVPPVAPPSSPVKSRSVPVC